MEVVAKERRPGGVKFEEIAPVSPSSFPGAKESEHGADRMIRPACLRSSRSHGLRDGRRRRGRVVRIAGDGSHRRGALVQGPPQEDGERRRGDPAQGREHGQARVEALIDVPVL